jgi:signal transduction histidine kinase
VTAKVPLEAVFRNLINNAIKHHDRPDGRIEISCRENGAWYDFTVGDDGPGIPPESHEQIFQMFETLKPRDSVEGSGMGLAIIKKIVESMGGRVGVDSAVGQGARFRFTWPKVMPLEG